jgi:glycosyltransferase involved in cell wall biosynthesis
MKIISLIVPCFNEQEVLSAYYDATLQALQKIEADYEFIFVDDGSKDNTLLLLKELAKKDGHVQYLSFSRNFGKEAAMLAGLKQAKGEYVVIMDADLQDPPSLLPYMYERLESKEADCVATRRSTRQGEPKLRSIFARCFYKLINRISETEIVDGARDYRMMSRRMTDAILALDETNRFSKGIFNWVGFKTEWISYENIERLSGKSKWNFWSLFVYAMDGIVSFSQTPLDLASFFGLFMTFLSIVSLLFIIVRKLLFGDPVQGWASLCCILLFIGGIQLFCLGIIGKYLAKTYLETKKRPHYIIAEASQELKEYIG